MARAPLYRRESTDKIIAVKAKVKVRLLADQVPIAHAACETTLPGETEMVELLLI